MKRMISLIAAWIVVAGAYLHGVSFPKPVGFVNDFAQIISDAEEKSLEQNLRSFEQTTSIEIAVVTVVSLEGLTIEDYTQRLVESEGWYVGKSGKDNGVVLLIAPNERETRIHTGYGVEPDLTDAQAGRIINTDMIPLFKEGKMSEGIVVGARRIQEELGLLSMSERTDKRSADLARVAQEEREAQERAKESAANMLRFVLVLVFVGSVGALILFIRYRVRQALERRRENEEMLAQCERSLADAWRRYPDTKKLLEKLVAEVPKELLDGQVSQMATYAASLQSVEALIARGRKMVQRDSVWGSSGTADYLKTVSQSIDEGLTQVLGAVETLDKNIRNAKSKALALSTTLPKTLQAVDQIIGHKDVTEAARAKVRRAKEAYYSQSKVMERFPVNWIAVNEELIRAQSDVESARQIAEQDKAMATEARQEGPKLVKKIPAMIQDAEALAQKKGSSQAMKFINEARAKFQAITPRLSSSVNWILVYPLILAVIALLKRVSEQIAKEKREKEEEEERRERRRRDSYRSSYASSSGWSSSSSSSGSFGGFGGGSFGGGGASGSW